MAQQSESEIDDNLAVANKGLQELMNDENELALFERFKSSPEYEARLHPGLKNESQYDSQRAMFRPSPSRLLSSVLEESLKDSDLMADLTYTPKGCGWTDVLDCIDAAKVLYDEKGKKSKVRAWARHADTTASALESLAGMIPDDNGLSVLREGLVFIFQAWQRRMQNREDVLRQLEDIPHLLSAAAEQWKLFPQEMRLRIATKNFYNQVTDSMTVLISVLLRKQKGSFFTKSIQRIPAVESKQIEDASNTIEKSRTALNLCMERIKEEHLAQISRTSMNIFTETRATRQTAHEIKSDTGIMMRSLHDINTRMEKSIMSMTEPQFEHVMRNAFGQWFREMMAAKMQTGLYSMVEENQYRQKLGYENNNNNNITTSIFSKNAMFLTTTKAQLLEHLGLSKIGSVVEDVDIIRRQGTTVAAEGLEHARKLMAMAQFNEWLGSDDSKLLLVDGHCQNFSNGKTSPLSVFCASLASILAQSESLVILQYFCGQHALDSEDLPGGPLGLVKSLVGQLLHQSDDVLPQNVRLNKRLYNEASHDDVDHLCEIFEVLFSQINTSKITICMLDEISEFEGERGGWVDGICLVADQLEFMVRQHKGPPTLKVLLTSANKSVMVSPRLREEERVSLRGYGLPNHSTGRLVISRSDLSLPRELSQGSSTYESK